MSPKTAQTFSQIDKNTIISELFLDSGVPNRIAGAYFKALWKTLISSGFQGIFPVDKWFLLRCPHCQTRTNLDKEIHMSVQTKTKLSKRNNHVFMIPWEGASTAILSAFYFKNKTISKLNIFSTGRGIQWLDIATGG